MIGLDDDPTNQRLRQMFAIFCGKPSIASASYASPFAAVKPPITVPNCTEVELYAIAKLPNNSGALRASLSVVEVATQGIH
jgi:hypothetical protein